MEMGIRIHLYTDGLLHAKSASLDKDISFFGSSNFDIRSFSLDFEIDLVFYEKDANLTLRSIQEGFLEKSIEINAEEWKKRGFKQRSLESIARLTSPML
jgi:cardiolipin synthase